VGGAVPEPLIEQGVPPLGVIPKKRTRKGRDATSDVTGNKAKPPKSSSAKSDVDAKRKEQQAKSDNQSRMSLSSGFANSNSNTTGASPRRATTFTRGPRTGMSTSNDGAPLPTLSLRSTGNDTPRKERREKMPRGSAHSNVDQERLAFSDAGQRIRGRTEKDETLMSASCPANSESRRTRERDLIGSSAHVGRRRDHRDREISASASSQNVPRRRSDQRRSPHSLCDSGLIADGQDGDPAMNPLVPSTHDRPAASSQHGSRRRIDQRRSAPSLCDSEPIAEAPGGDPARSPIVPSTQDRTGSYNSFSSPRVLISPVHKSSRRGISDKLSPSVGLGEREDTEEIESAMVVAQQPRKQNNGAVDIHTKNDQPNQAQSRHMSAVDLRGRIKMGDAASGARSKLAEGFDAASVVVPFAEVIPEKVLKVKRRKEKAIIGEMSFSDLAFDNGFSDLYDGL
jgi:hypothetical protein